MGFVCGEVETAKSGVTDTPPMRTGNADMELSFQRESQPVAGDPDHGGASESDLRKLLRPHREKRPETGRAKRAALVGDNQRIPPETTQRGSRAPAPILGD